MIPIPALDQLFQTKIPQALLSNGHKQSQIVYIDKVSECSNYYRGLKQLFNQTFLWFCLLRLNFWLLFEVNKVFFS